MVQVTQSVRAVLNRAPIDKSRDGVADGHLTRLSWLEDEEWW